MRTAYRVLAYLVAAEVVVQAAAMAFGVAGLSHWVNTGGVFDRAVLDGNVFPFPEVAGFIVHGINGSIVVPALALSLVVASVFAKVPRGSSWAVAVFVLVGIQATLGFSAADLPALGALHGVNALLLFATAFFAGRRVRVAAPAEVPADPVRSTAEV
jgi:hypothetical protein